jgi:biopolymer transport protein ExbB
MIRLVLALAIAVLPTVAGAWWNDEWKERKAVNLDAGAKGANLQSAVSDAPVVVRLHAGNFNAFFSVREDTADLRFVAGDDKTPLKHHVEKFDLVNEIALIWVKLPKLSPGEKPETVWLYYGNGNASQAADAGGTYDTDQALVFHFDGPGNTIQDKTAYANHPAQSSAQINAASLIGGGAKFAGKESITVNASPSLHIVPDEGWTFSTWIKIDGAQKDANVVHAHAGDQSLVLAVDGTGAYGRYRKGGRTQETAKGGTLIPGSWHHIALVAAKDKLSVHVDGEEVASTAIALADGDMALSIGAAASGGNFLTGELDEVQVATMARSADWLRLAARGQGAEAKLVTFGENEGESGGGTSYFGTILQSVTVDGWVVIFLLAIMAAISWWVMVSKGLVIARIRKDNRAFLEKFRSLSARDADSLDREETDEERELDSSALLTALSGKHDHYQSSTLYHLYHAGIHELRLRAGKAVGADFRGLSTRAIAAMRATVDAALVRETEKLNSQMVLLTIAISGGPFLGLLGTVIGVMITFAAIAATGDVNINAIAPGIAAALVATVAGLAVAIPALFGYNWLSSQIRDINADMRVFVDEFIAKLAEDYGD